MNVHYIDRADFFPRKEQNFTLMLQKNLMYSLGVPFWLGLHLNRDASFDQILQLATPVIFASTPNVEGVRDLKLRMGFSSWFPAFRNQKLQKVPFFVGRLLEVWLKLEKKGVWDKLRLFSCMFNSWFMSQNDHFCAFCLSHIWESDKQFTCFLSFKTHMCDWTVRCCIRHQYAKKTCITDEPRKKPSYFPLYWMVNRDPYNGLL